MSGAASVRTMMMLVSSVGRKPFLTTPKTQTVATIVPSVSSSISHGTRSDAVERDAIAARHQRRSRASKMRDSRPGLLVVHVLVP